MKLYRGCMFGVFGAVIGLFSLILGRAFGLIGFLIPPVLVGFVYMLVESVIVELYYLLEDRDQHY